MKQPSGFEKGENLVRKLKKGIYGLKQAAKLWNDESHKVLTEIGFARSENDVCLYSKLESDGWCHLLVYVDDMTLTAKSLDTIERMKTKIASKIEIQDLGDMKYYLGMEVTRDDNGIFHLCQSNYIRKMINSSEWQTQRFRMFQWILATWEEEKTTMRDYCSQTLSTGNWLAAYSMLHVSVCTVHCTRPDIASSISILS